MSGHCECIEKTEVIEKRWDCEGEWDVDALEDCAIEAGKCIPSCLVAPVNPAACADCLCMVDAECCGGDGCTLCDFRDCYKEDGTLEEFEGSVFFYFDGDDCGG